MKKKRGENPLRKKCNLARLPVLLLSIGIMLLLTGCLPPDFSKEYAKKQAQEHYQDAKDWFDKNRPDAKLGSKCTSLDDGQNLYAAVCGTYSVKGNHFQYIYDFANQGMYLEEDYSEVCKEIEEEMSEALKLPKECGTFHSEGITIEGQCANDNPDAIIKAGTPLTVYGKKLLPAGVEAADFAKETLLGNTTMELFPIISPWNLNMTE